MKLFSLIILAMMVLVNQSFAQGRNDFYGQAPLKKLGKLTVEIGGEVQKARIVDFGKLPARDLIVRVTDRADGLARFTGAYHCQGYSLFDILKDDEVNKKTARDFNLPLDLVVLVENAKGERVVIGWGEIFYPAVQHRIILAESMAPIIPTKSEDNWPLPEGPQLICSQDLYTVRTLDNPTRLTVLSLAGTIKSDRDVHPLYYAEPQIFGPDAKAKPLSPATAGAEERIYPCFFYGRGMGYHGYTDFKGLLLEKVLGKVFDADREALRTGCWLISARDGYRIAVTCSEVSNRNDQASFLVIDRGKEDGGRYSLFPAMDFFSDRAVKAIQEIRFVSLKK